MKLQTQISIQKETINPISYHSNLILIGSCFSENIGEKLNYYKFNTFQNPFGILFHPKAIEKIVTDAINERIFTEKNLFFHNERWHSFEAHSELSSPSKETLLENLNSNITATNKQLKNASHIIITLGTAWVYRFIKSDNIVANCHKVPQKKFLKELLSVDEITESLEAIIALIKSINNKATILFTISPVRHLKDGFIENQQSKSHLIAAVHQVVEPKKNTHYFPSYEIMMDELRDYRFYAEDMIHPNQTAINCIWQKFSDAWISDSEKETIQLVETIQKGLAHKPFNQNSKEHQAFIKNLEHKIAKLHTKHPSINF